MPKGVRAVRISPGVLAGDSNHTSGAGLVRVHINIGKAVKKVRLIKIIMEDIKKNPVSNLIVPVATTVVVYVALQLLPMILQ